MPGRHQAGMRRRPQRTHRRGLRLRWLVGVAGGALVGATLLAFSSAGATPSPVKATFGVTGVATDGCPVSAGGTDVYVKPGQDLQVKTSLLGLYILQGLIPQQVDLNDIVNKIASFDGALKIDPGTSNQIKLDISNKAQTVSGLSAGDHPWTWTVDTVTLLSLLKFKLHIDNSVVGAGAKLTWNGTIHVTSKTTKCGVAIQLPSVSASASVTGLPPVKVGVPGVKVSVPVNLPTGLPTSAPTGGGKKHNGGGQHSSAAPQPPANNPVPVPAQVVPLGGGAVGGGTGLLPGSGSGDNGGAARPGGSGSTPAVQPVAETNTGKRTVDLAAGRASSTGEVWVVLAIVAVIALAFVAATYARLYLLKREG